MISGQDPHRILLVQGPSGSGKTALFITHSIPEPNGLAIKTPLGTVLHTGDWKIDEDPVIGERVDVPTIRRLGDEGVLAMVCDSTNVFVDVVAGSEADVRVNLAALIATLKGKVAVACFASNVARLDSVVHAAEAADRRVCLVGRSIHRITAAAKSVGLFKDVPEFVSETEAGYFPADKILYTTGRLTSEMVIKTVRMGIPILVSRSGFTAWGVELARQVGLTLVGRTRGKRFIALSGEERIVYDQNLDYVEEESARHRRKGAGGNDE